MMKIKIKDIKKQIASFEFISIILSLFLSFIGISFIYSSGLNLQGISVSNEYIKQIIWVSIGFFTAIFISFIDYRKIVNLSFYIYILFLFLLIINLFLPSINGAKSWINFGNISIQPSEFSKSIFILYLSKYLEQNKKNIKSLRVFLTALFIMLIPMALILTQPDIGTASVFFAIFCFTCLMANIRIRYILFLIFLGLFTIIFAMMPVWIEKITKRNLDISNIFNNLKLRNFIIIISFILFVLSFISNLIFKRWYFYWLSYILLLMFFIFSFSLILSKVLKEYQIMRLVIFLDPYIDPLDSGWNIIQSITAIGSGGLNGKGYTLGTQSHYNFLPKQSTDFIFSILAEEWGFVGCIIVISLFLLLIIRLFFIMFVIKDNLGSLIISGIIGMIFFHMFINIGMTIGMMPITGIPLLFLSYGGSAMWTSFITIGLVMSIFRVSYERRI